ncbi:hypothetical protein NUW58_g1633 [Xylaria curta]|uniref:Uncharacterized protein n=1 Tax=Xylaria curta TaxID=42375 RepID=A0ACC1PJE8_9PEZI|nr:hypothetical protein NUW58_g1633 [Xylaria curta]
MAHLLNTPLEVLLQITSYLTTPDYGHLRRTCRQLEAALFGAFTKEFFSKRQFALMEFSIQALVDISKSRLAPCLTHLIIHLEHPNALGPPGTKTYEQAVRDNLYQAEYINHWEFITTGRDVEMLTDAIKHLPNLETIGMRDFNSRNRSRDDTAWNSYGCPTLARKTSYLLVLPNTSLHLFPSGRGPEYISHVFLTILRAIGNTAVHGCGPTVTRIEVLLHNCRFLDTSFKIPDRFETGISLALSKLKALLLDGLCEDRPFFFVNDVASGSKPIVGAGYFLSRFLEKASALEHLRLNFQFYTQHPTERILLWLANARDPKDAQTSTIDSPTAANCVKASESLPAHFPPAPKFPNLRALDIGMATVTQAVLIALYTNYKSTLRDIQLHKMTLATPVNTKSNLWDRFCNKMRDVDLELTTFRLAYLRQTSNIRSTRKGQVTFNDPRSKQTKIWRGTAFSQAIKDITGEMESHWDESENDESDESMSDGEDSTDE